MKAGSFILGGVHSDELNSVIQFRPAIQTPKRRISLVEVSGRSGSVPFDERSYENVPMELSLFTKASRPDELLGLKDAITFAFDSGTYMDFIPYFDPDKVYKVLCEEPPLFNGSGQFDDILTYTTTLTVKPFKSYLSGLNKMVDVSNGVAVVNPSFYPSEPVITIYGSGDVTLYVNEQPFVIRNIDEYIIINSDIEHSYKEYDGIVVGRDDRVFTLSYPKFSRGSNFVSWSGNVTRVSVEPRWKTLV